MTTEKPTRMGPTPSTEATRHTDQSIPYEWRAIDHAGETLLVHDVPEGLSECYQVLGRTLEVSMLPAADAVLYEGTIVEPTVEEATKRVRLDHAFAGTTARLPEEGHLGDAVVLLERCDHVDLDQRLIATNGGSDD